MSDEELGFRLRFVGRRFDGARLPVGVLPDIEAFRDLIVAFAKSNWLEAHESRQRVPRGFDAQLSLDLVVIDEGSAVPVLKLSGADPQGFLPGMFEARYAVLETAYQRMSNVLDDAENDSEYRPVLTRDQISALNRFGAGLRDHEKVEFLGTKGRSGEVVSLDSYRRKNLITRLRETYEKRYEGDGYLNGVFADGKIIVRVPEYGDIPLDVGDRALDEFDGYLLNDVSIDMTLELDAQDKVRGVKDIHSVDMYEPLSERARNAIDRSMFRLAELAEFEPGWLDGQGEKIAESAVAQAKYLVKGGTDWFASAGIFPTLSGGIQIEVEHDSVDLTILIDNNGGVSGFIIDDSDASDEIVDLNDLASVVNAIRQYADSNEEQDFAG